MKKWGFLILTFCISLPLFSQSNVTGAHPDMVKLFSEFGTEMDRPKTIGSYEMLQRISTRINPDLAYTYLWQKNQFMKPEETNCHPVGYYVDPETNLAVFFFYSGAADNLFYTLTMQVYNIKSAKLTDELFTVGGFAHSGSACSLHFSSMQNIRVRTVSGLEDNTLSMQITKSGKIKAL